MRSSIDGVFPCRCRVGFQKKFVGFGTDGFLGRFWIPIDIFIVEVAQKQDMTCFGAGVLYDFA